jgi:hypothetical protein
LLSGLLVTINGIVYDLGMPGWLVVRLPKKEKKGVLSNISKRKRQLLSQPLARCSPLPVEWWNKRPKPVGKEKRALEVLIGPAAYRGRSIRSVKTSERAGKSSDRIPIMDTDLSEKHIPSHSIVSESVGFKRPSSRPKPSNEKSDTESDN